jgi:hypothetical protein
MSNEAKHTKGRWTNNPNLPLEVWTYGEDVDGPHRICFVQSIDNPGEAAANAALIAAAPEMLDALKRVMTGLDYMDKGHPALPRARAIIAKAEVR